MRKKDKLNILYEDKYILAVSKPENILSIATTKEKENTLYRKVSDYVKKQNKNNKVFIVHRLDKETSGIVLFAKDLKTKYKLQETWSSTVRKYYAIVEGNIVNRGIIKNYLAETKYLKTYITNDKNKGKIAITKYEPIQNNKDYTLLNIEILTGRKNQIRVHMSSIKHPIIGDKKYGYSKNNRMYLQAYYLEFNHPVDNKRIIIEEPITENFLNLMDKH